jgi:hypothetical protein
MDFIIDQILMRYSAFDTGEQVGVHQLFIDSEKRSMTLERTMYNILMGFGVPMKLVWLIKMCLNEMYSKVYIGKHLSDAFHT